MPVKKLLSISKYVSLVDIKSDTIIKKTMIKNKMKKIIIIGGGGHAGIIYDCIKEQKSLI